MRARAGTQRRLITGAAAVVAVLGLAEAMLRLAYADEALPRTSVAGVAVGGAGPVELRRRLAPLARRPAGVVFEDGARRLRVGARAAGVRLRVAATADRVLSAGRGRFLGGAGSAVAGLVVPRSVRPVVAVDERVLERAVGRLARRIGRPAQTGDLRIDPASLAVTAVAPRTGRRLDRDRAASLVRAAAASGRTVVRALPVETTRAATAAQVQAVAQQARAYLTRPLRLDVAGRTIRVARADLARELTVRPGRRPALGLRPAGLETLVDEIAARRDRPARDGRPLAPAVPARSLAEKGDTSWRPVPVRVGVRRARPGREVDRARARAAIAAAVRSGDHEAELEVARVAPAVTTRSARSVDSLLGTFTTFFACCEPRVQNIRAIARAVDGAVVAPGASFSLNAAAGRRTRAKGYVPAPFIADGKIVPSVGGGVSQFSTTVYNAAYFAGLRLDFHQPHSIFIDRYPAGREATLDYDTIDLRWTNDTDAPVLVRASSTETSVTVSLYGRDSGRRVRAVSGARTRPAGSDFAVTVTREVRYGGERVERQPYTTTYDLPPAAE